MLSYDCKIQHDNKIFFSDVNNVKYDNLQIDEVGKYSITKPKMTDKITTIIINDYKKLCVKKYKNENENENENIIITDATACVGGDVISFCKYNMKVNIVEIDEKRYNMLLNNINEYNYNENIISKYNENYIKIYDNIKQDIIYIDPPWGGKKYILYNKIRLNFEIIIGDDIKVVSVEELCLNIIEKKIAKMIVLKLPFNYDIKNLCNKIKNNIKTYILRKILLVIIEC